MATLVVPAVLRSFAQEREEIESDATTVAQALAEISSRLPHLAARIIDETGTLRRHVSLFINDQQASLEQALHPGDRVYIVPAISGGNDDVSEGSPSKVEILLGTKKGLFALRGPRGGALTTRARQFPGEAVEYAIRDPRSGRVFAAVTHGQFGPRLFYRDDPAAEGGWQEAALAFPEDAGIALERIWVVTPGELPGELWAGVAPAALFHSTDDGATWRLVRGLFDQPTRAEWSGGLGGLALHSICPWPGEPLRLSVAISAVGVWHTEDGGESWHRGVQGLVPRYLPAEAREGTLMHCVHKLLRSSLEPRTLYLQFHGGVYRSDDAGESWREIGGVGRAKGLPADFGFPLALDPRDPSRAFVVPLVSDFDRVTPEGRVRVYETRDRGESWIARGEGLPQTDAHLTILRQAFSVDGGDPLGLYFGATSGELFGSFDDGQTWSTIAKNLPPIHSVQSSLI